MGLCNQIVQFPQALHNKTGIPQVGQDAERLIENQLDIADHHGPNEHGAEALLRRQGRISLVHDRGHAQPKQKGFGEPSRLLPGHILVVLPDQGNIAPDGQVGDKGRLERYKPQPRLARRDKTLQRLLQFLFIFEEV